MKGLAKRALARITPSRSLNLRSSVNIANFRDLVKQSTGYANVLIIGGRIVGHGIENLIHDKSVQVVETDAQFGPRSQIICDAHQLPFRDGAFRGTVIQAVLEHVLEPHVCVEEIWRVLVDRGFVYAETPFMQQVHGSPYDFQRYTYLGHRRLFRRFEEVESGPVAGPATVLVWAWEHFIVSFSDQPRMKGLLRRLARISGGWLKHMDRILLTKDGAWDSASAYFFLGRKSHNTLSDDVLLGLFRG
jgi:hypothetical protein